MFLHKYVVVTIFFNDILLLFTEQCFFVHGLQGDRKVFYTNTISIVPFSLYLQYIKRKCNLKQCGITKKQEYESNVYLYSSICGKCSWSKIPVVLINCKHLLAQICNHNGFINLSDLNGRHKATSANMIKLI